MKALIRTKAGKGFSTMKVEDIAEPELDSTELRVKMVTSRVNPVDMDLMKGFPSLKLGVITEIWEFHSQV